MKDIPWDMPIPDCDLCGKEHGGIYDAPMLGGIWADMCEKCWRQEGHNDDTLGSRRVSGLKPPTKEETARDIRAAIDAGNFDMVEELIGDGDIFEFL